MGGGGGFHELMLHFQTCLRPRALASCVTASVSQKISSTSWQGTMVCMFHRGLSSAQGEQVAVLSHSIREYASGLARPRPLPTDQLGCGDYPAFSKQIPSGFNREFTGVSLQGMIIS